MYTHFDRISVCILSYLLIFIYAATPVIVIAPIANNIPLIVPSTTDNDLGKVVVFVMLVLPYSVTAYINWCMCYLDVPCLP